MRKIFLIFGCAIVLAGCGCGEPGDMQCQGSRAMMCGAYNSWEVFQDCGSIGMSCSTAPGACGGYAGIACCY